MHCDQSQLLSSKGLEKLQSDILPNWLPKCRWFSGKGQTIKRVSIVRTAQFQNSVILAAEVNYLDSQSEIYNLPVILKSKARQCETIARWGAGIALCDALHDSEFQRSLLETLVGTTTIESFSSRYSGPLPDSELTSQYYDVEQSNSAILYSDQLFVKVFRKLHTGINPDQELSDFLTHSTDFKHSSQFLGAIKWHDYNFALASQAVANQGDAWTLALKHFNDGKPSTDWLQRIERLGQRTAEMHIAFLASDSKETDIKPAPFTTMDFQNCLVQFETLEVEMKSLLAAKLSSLDDTSKQLAEVAINTKWSSRFSDLKFDTLKCRTHSDYHLGQVLDTGDDFVIIDFEGEPSRPLQQRRMKHPPVRDVAGMARSFHYAAHVALRELKRSSKLTKQQAEIWAGETRARFIDAWQKTISAGIENEPVIELLQFYETEKAIYEVIYEINNRPDWVKIPLRGLFAQDSTHLTG